MNDFFENCLMFLLVVVMILIGFGLAASFYQFSSVQNLPEESRCLSNYYKSMTVKNLPVECLKYYK